MHWEWEVFCKSIFDVNVTAPLCFGEPGDITYIDWMLSAWGWTLSVSASSFFVALILGIVVGTIRTLPANGFFNKSLILIGNGWTELFRNIPLLVQIFLWYHVIPAFVPVMKDIHSFYLVIFALGFFTSARISEVVKAGIQSLSRGLRSSSMALGLTTVQAYRYVILPMALRLVIPPLTSESMNIIKNSSVAFAVSIPELTLFAIQVQEETAQGMEVYLGVTTLYISSALFANRIMAFIESRTRVQLTMSVHHQ